MIPYVRVYIEMELPKANSHSIAPHCCLNCVCVCFIHIHVLFSLDFFCPCDQRVDQEIHVGGSSVQAIHFL